MPMKTLKATAASSRVSLLGLPGSDRVSAKTKDCTENCCAVDSEQAELISRASSYDNEKRLKVDALAAVSDSGAQQLSAAAPTRHQAAPSSNRSRLYRRHRASFLSAR